MNLIDLPAEIHYNIFIMLNRHDQLIFRSVNKYTSGFIDYIKINRTYVLSKNDAKKSYFDRLTNVIVRDKLPRYPHSTVWLRYDVTCVADDILTLSQYQYLCMLKIKTDSTIDLQPIGDLTQLRYLHIENKNDNHKLTRLEYLHTRYQDNKYDFIQKLCNLEMLYLETMPHMLFLDNLTNLVIMRIDNFYTHVFYSKIPDNVLILAECYCHNELYLYPCKTFRHNKLCVDNSNIMQLKSVLYNRILLIWKIMTLSILRSQPIIFDSVFNEAKLKWYKFVETKYKSAQLDFFKDETTWDEMIRSIRNVRPYYRLPYYK